MDIHLINEIDIEQVKSAHLEDLSVQEKYNVKYHQFWVNEATNTVFCLMEGPDKESCAAVHREANGLEACKIVEVEGGLYDLFMGKDRVIDHGLVRHLNGEIDSGFRFILSLDIISQTTASDKVDFSSLKLPHIPRGKAIELITKHEGQVIRGISFDYIMGVFRSPHAVLKSAYAIQKLFDQKIDKGIQNSWNIKYNMGISIGQPLTEKDGFFEKAVQVSYRLCQVAGHREILVPRYFEEICGLNEIMEQHIHLRILEKVEQDFLDELMDITEEKLADAGFSVESLGREIGVSRPQLYRKVLAVTGKSPVSFIRDIRLNKALILIRENKLNISEIALEVGYNNPSYFSKTFYQKYGVKPSMLVI